MTTLLSTLSCLFPYTTLFRSRGRWRTTCRALTAEDLGEMQARFDKDGKQLPDTGHGCGCRLCAISNAPRYERRDDPRSEEHTSELQSHSDLVCRLLLEKKKKT